MGFAHARSDGFFSCSKGTRVAEPPLSDGLIREIEEDLREEKLARLWKTYGSWIIAACVALVIGVALGEAWQSYRQSVRAEAGARFTEALQLAGDDPAVALDHLGTLATDAPAGVGLLARFRAAALTGEIDSPAAAAAAYQGVAEEIEDQPLYRDLALILATMNDMAAGAAPANAAALIDRLAPLDAADNPWRFTARELIAHLALQTGERTRAREVFQGLADDPDTPAGIRARAGDMLAAAS